MTVDVINEAVELMVLDALEATVEDMLKIMDPRPFLLSSISAMSSNTFSISSGRDVLDDSINSLFFVSFY